MSDTDDRERATVDEEEEAAGADADDDPAGGDASTSEVDDGEVAPESVADRAAEHDPELGLAVEGLATRIDELEAAVEERDEQIDDLESRLKRKQAEFQNYKKRQERRREELKERAAEDLVEQLLPVRDNLVRALDQGEDADIRGGVESTLSEFDRVLESEGVEVVDAEPGEETDPHRHEVMLRVESDRPEGTIEEVFKPGYRMGEKVIREAQVTVSDGGDDATDGSGGDATES